MHWPGPMAASCWPSSCPGRAPSRTRPATGCVPRPATSRPTGASRPSPSRTTPAATSASGPLTLGHAIHDMGGEVLVHVACRERNRASLEIAGLRPRQRGAHQRAGPLRRLPEGRLPRPLAAGLRHRLGGAPLAAPRRLRARPALHDRGCRQPLQGARGGPRPAAAEAGPQGARRRLLRHLPGGLGRALAARAHALERGAAAWASRSSPPSTSSSRGVARVFHRDEIPGIRLSAELLAMVEAAAESPDKGRGRFLELAAMQVAVARGLGYAGVYVAGQRDAAELDRRADHGGRLRPRRLARHAGRGLLPGARRPPALRAR